MKAYFISRVHVTTNQVEFRLAGGEWHRGYPDRVTLRLYFKLELAKSAVKFGNDNQPEWCYRIHEATLNMEPMAGTFQLLEEGF